MLVSITIPVYNDYEGLRKSLLSLIAQTYDNWEAIVVDDGSLRNLKHIIDDLNDNRIKFFRFETNQGRPTARQKTFELLSGEYCGFLDAGDCYSPSYIKNGIDVFSNPHLIGVSQSMIVRYQGEAYESNYSEGLISLKDDRYNAISFASTIFKSSFCKEYIFDTHLKYSQDRHFLNYLSSNFDGEIYLLNSHAYIYDQGNNMKVSTTYRKYYYDTIRLISEKKMQATVVSVLKMLIMPAVQMIFGYKKILELRFKKK